MFIHFNVVVAACKIYKIKCFNLSKMNEQKKAYINKIEIVGHNDRQSFDCCRTKEVFYRIMTDVRRNFEH